MKTSHYSVATQPILPVQPAIKYNQKSKQLGAGFYGIVYQASYSQKTVAVKRIQLVDLVNRPERNATEKLDHDNVLKLFSVQQDDDFLYLVLELCLATLEDYFRGQTQIKMPSEMDALKQMANGLDYIHKCSLVHRDIKPTNVLIWAANTRETVVLKLSDFGFVKLVTGRESFFSKSTAKNSLYYMAPEYRQFRENTNHRENKEDKPNVSIDLFSLGCLFFTYLTNGKHPFATPAQQSKHYILINLEKGKKDLQGNGLKADHLAYQIIDGMTQISPVKRWKLDQVLHRLRQIPTPKNESQINSTGFNFNNGQKASPSPIHQRISWVFSFFKDNLAARDSH